MPTITARYIAVLFYGLGVCIPYSMYAQSFLKDVYAKHVSMPQQVEAVQELIAQSRFFETKSFDSSLVYARRAQQLAKAYSLWDAYAEATYLQGRAAFYQRELGQADSLLRQAKYLAILQQDSLLLADIFNVEGSLQNVNGEWQAALRYYESARQIYEALGKLQALAKIYYNVGLTYERQEKQARAVTYWRKSERLSAMIGDTNLIILNAQVLGHSYVTYNLKLDSAKFYFEKALKLSQKHAKDYFLASCYSGLANLNRVAGRNIQASRYYHAQLDAAVHAQDIEGQFTATFGLSSLYQEANKLDSARFYAYQSLQVAQEKKLTKRIGRCWEVLRDIEIAAENWPHAMSYMDSMYKHQQIELRRMRDMELDNVERAFAAQKERIEAEQAQALREQRLLIQLENASFREWAWAVGLGLLVLVVMLLYRLAHMRQKQHQLLAQKNTELEDEKNKVLYLNNCLEEQVEVRTKALQARNAQLARYAQMNAHEVRGPLSGILGLAQLYTDGLIENESEKDQIIEGMAENSRRLDEVLFRINHKLAEHQASSSLLK